MNVTVDRQVCVGCGRCSDICPALFEIVGCKAVTTANPVPPDAESDCQQAIAMCPQTAISVGVPHAFMLRSMNGARQWVAI